MYCNTIMPRQIAIEISRVHAIAGPQVICNLYAVAQLPYGCYGHGRIEGRQNTIEPTK